MESLGLMTQELDCSVLLDESQQVSESSSSNVWEKYKQQVKAYKRFSIICLPLEPSVGVYYEKLSSVHFTVYPWESGPSACFNYREKSECSVNKKPWRHYIRLEIRQTVEDGVWKAMFMLWGYSFWFCVSMKWGFCIYLFQLPRQDKTPFFHCKTY